MDSSNEIICSFDVGITHLSYCVLQKNNSTCEIIDWNIINSMSDDKMRNLLCLCRTRKNEICRKKPKYVMEVIYDYDEIKGGEVLGFCEMHKEHSEEYDIFNKYCINYISEIINSNKFYECKHTLKNNKICGKKSKYIFDGKEYCNNHYNLNYKKSIEKYSLKEFKKNKIKGTAIKNIQLNLLKILDSKPELLQVDEIIIENQPSLKNPTMKSIASLIFNYYMIRGIIDKEKTKSRIKNVQFICPSNKLKINQDNTLSVLSRTTNDKYKRTKELGIKYCKQLINKKWNDFLDKFKKKDDLCDAYLQGFYYLQYYKKKNKIKYLV